MVVALSFSTKTPPRRRDRIWKLEKLVSQIGKKGRWCGSTPKWTTANSIVCYDSLFFSDTNMKLKRPALDIDTGDR